jgi:hypothetical protein
MWISVCVCVYSVWSLLFVQFIDNKRFEEVLLGVQEQRNILHEISKRKANWIGHILRRNCLLQRVIEGKIKGGIEVTGRRGRRRRKLLDDLKERRRYSHLKEEALDRSMWRARFGRGFGPVVRQTTEWMKPVIHIFRRSCCRTGDLINSGEVLLLLISESFWLPSSIEEIKYRDTQKSSYCCCSLWVCIGADLGISHM